VFFCKVQTGFFSIMWKNVMPQRRRVISQTDSRWTFISEARFRCRDGHYRVFFFSTRTKSAGTYLSSSISLFPCQYHSTIAPYSFIHLPPTLYNVFLPELQFPPVSIIPHFLRTQSFSYHRRCITIFSQYFTFPLSVSLQHCSIPTFTLTLLSPGRQIVTGWSTFGYQCSSGHNNTGTDFHV
jgi:hypothetical protein